jgi:hypothetical protein
MEMDERKNENSSRKRIISFCRAKIKPKLHYKCTAINPMRAGRACTKKIFFDAVKAPYSPAISTQVRKNTAT